METARGLLVESFQYFFHARFNNLSTIGFFVLVNLSDSCKETSHSYFEVGFYLHLCRMDRLEIWPDLLLSWMEYLVVPFL